MYDTTIETDHIFALGNKRAPPGFLDLSFQFDTNGTVIVKARVSVVYFTAGENQTPPFAQTDNFFHGIMDGQGLDLAATAASWLLWRFVRVGCGRR